MQENHIEMGSHDQKGKKLGMDENINIHYKMQKKQKNSRAKFF